MKKRRLKKWVRYTLGFICLGAILVGTSECEDIKVFMISHIIACIVLFVFGSILVKDINK